MSKTVSFVARDELVDWLESQADEEMKTISSLCQDIIASEYRRQTQENPDKSANTGGGGEKSGVDDSSRKDDKSPLEQPPFSEHTQAWYRPNVQDDDVVIAVRNPTDSAETRRYYKTYDGAAQAIRRWWK